MRNGLKLCLVLGIFLSGCRSDEPPPIEICNLNQAGGARCRLVTGQNVTKLPSELSGYWATSQQDMARFSAWCFDTSYTNAMRTLLNVENELRKSENEPHH